MKISKSTILKQNLKKAHIYKTRMYEFDFAEDDY